MPGDDGIVFHLDTLSHRETQLTQRYPGLQVKIEAHLDRSRIYLRSDIGFSDIIYPQPVQFDYPTLLDMPAPRIYTYTELTVIAEKFDAMAYQGQEGSRIKDYYDLWHLSSRVQTDLHELSTAIMTTMNHRGHQR